MTTVGRQQYSEAEQAFYRAYLNSPAWRLRKTARIRVAGYRCEWVTDDFLQIPQRCPRTRYLCVHHNTYERLGNELDSDLDVYCWFHHMLEHLLWKKCAMCTDPALENEINGAAWLNIMLSTMQIDLDTGPVNWKNLPNKEVLLDQVPHYCPACSHYLAKDD